jgi:hypothetical protein
LAVAKQTLVYARQNEKAAAIVAINSSREAVEIPIAFGGDREFQSQLGVTGNLILSAGAGKIHLPAHSAEIYADPPMR